MSLTEYGTKIETARRRAGRIGRREHANNLGCFGLFLAIIGVVSTAFYFGWMRFPPSFGGSLLMGCGLAFLVFCLPPLLVLVTMRTFGMGRRDALVYRLIDDSDLDSRVVELIGIMNDESDDSPEVRAMAMRLALLKVHQAAMKAHEQGVTAIEIEAYLEMNINAKPEGLACDPLILAPLLDYLEAIRSDGLVQAQRGLETPPA